MGKASKVLILVLFRFDFIFLALRFDETW